MNLQSVSKNKTIIITGASRGIGKEVVVQLSKNKFHKIYALSRNLNKMNQSFNHLTNVTCVSFDLNGNIEEQLEEIVRKEESIDVLINNAGLLINKEFNKLTSKDLLLSYQVNVFGVIKTIQQCYPKLNKSSHIVNISSIGGYQGSVKFAGLAAYSSAKAAICNITEILAEEYKESGIKINCLCLGAVQTEMLEEAFPDYLAPTKPDEMAQFISDFALTGSKFFNGKIIPVSISTP